MTDSESKDFELIKPGEIRTRIAPATTGFLHLGTARSALFNFLFARKNHGYFILRVEDTDQKRYKPEWEQSIYEPLTWLGLEWEEGPDKGGDYGPYRQSERSEIYKKYLEKLLAENKAYYCFCTPEDLEAQRQYLLSQGKPPIYNGSCGQLSAAEVKNNLAAKKDFIIRFRSTGEKIVFEDLIRGKVEFDTSLIGDFSLARDFGSPLYNFACVIDDFEMKISHVIRGEDHISNTPKQILIQKALGLETPQYAHLPLILAPDKSKLSKRHGSVSLDDYRQMGYLPEAMVNFLAFLGWNPGTEREIFSLPSLIKEFDLKRVKKAGAIFNIKRLDFINGFYIRNRPLEKLTRECLPYLLKAGLLKKADGEALEKDEFPARFPELKIAATDELIDFETLQKIIAAYQERLKNLKEITELADYFFANKLSYDKDLLKWKEQTDQQLAFCLDEIVKVLSDIEISDWQPQKLEEILLLQAEKISAGISRAGDRGYVLWPLRMALTAKKASAGPFEVAAILGKEKVLKRIKQARELLKL